MKTENPKCETCATRHLSPFAMCGKDEVENISFSKSCNYYSKGQYIFSENSLPIGLFCVSKGHIKIVKYGAGGKEQILRIANAGDVLGYRSLVVGKRYSVSAVAITDAAVCILPRKEFLNMLQNNPKFHQEILNLICKEAEVTENRMTDIAYKPAKGRIADALLLLNQSKNDQEIQLSREELASYAGIVKETAIRILSELKKDELIKITKRKIQILDIDALVQLSHQYD